MMHNAGEENKSANINILSAIARVILTYDPDNLGNSFIEGLNTRPYLFITPQALVNAIMENRKDFHGKDEMKSAFEHLGLLRNVKL